MAKAQLRAGAEIDFLTADELQELLDRHFSGFLRPPQTVRVRDGFNLDSSGNSSRGGTQVAIPIFEVPAGYTVRIHRIRIAPDGYTFGSPFTAAGGFWELQRAGEFEAGGSFVSGVGSLPAVQSWGTADAPSYSNGESVDVYVNAGPASKPLRVGLQGTLEPHVSQ